MVNLLDCAKGKGMRDTYIPETVDFKNKKSKQGVEVTVLDERDGYCTSFYTTLLIPSSHLNVPLELYTNPLLSPLRRRTSCPCSFKTHC